MAGPTAFFFQRHREIPVIEGDIRCQAQLQAFVDDAMIKGDAFLIHPADAFGKNAGPGNRETEDGKTQGFGEQDIILVTVIKIAGQGWTTAALDLALSPGEGVPDGQPFTIAVPCAFIVY